MDNNVYISGYTTSDIDEIDNDDIDLKIKSAFDNYDAYNLIDSFDSDDFETIFKINIPLILTFDARDIITICRILESKVYTKYEYQISPKPIYNDIKDVISFFDFIKFLQFDNSSFLSFLLSEMGLLTDDIIKMKKIDDIINMNKIMDYVDIIALRYKYNTFIHEYLLNHSKEKINEWLNEIFIKNKEFVLAELNEGGTK